MAKLKGFYTEESHCLENLFIGGQTKLISFLLFLWRFYWLTEILKKFMLWNKSNLFSFWKTQILKNFRWVWKGLTNFMIFLWNQGRLFIFYFIAFNIKILDQRLFWINFREGFEQVRRRMAGIHTICKVFSVHDSLFEMLSFDRFCFEIIFFLISGKNSF